MRRADLFQPRTLTFADVGDWYAKDQQLADRWDDSRRASCLLECARLGAKAWPNLAVPAPVWLSALAAALHERCDDGAEAIIATVFVADLYLATACRAGVPGAANSFELECVDAARRTLLKMQLSNDVIDDQLQQAREQLLVADVDKLASYQGRGRLASWVTTYVVRRAISHLRRNHRTTFDDDQLSLTVDTDYSPELTVLRQKCQGQFKAAFRAAVSGLEVKARNLLRMHYVDHVSLAAIAKLHGVHKATAFRWLDEARDAVQRATIQRLRDHAGLTADEVAELTRLVASQIDLSMSRVFRDDLESAGR
jgi:RNA polymerase sigma-70 factor, ECF subfamily